MSIAAHQDEDPTRVPSAVPSDERVAIPDLGTDERRMVEEVVGRLRRWHARNAVFQEGLDRVADALEGAVRPERQGSVQRLFGPSRSAD